MQRGTAIVVAVVSVLPPSAAMAQQPKAADAIVRSGIPVVLEIPPGDMTFNVIREVLQAAGALHGIEQAPRTADAAPVDFGRRPNRVVRLDGTPVGEALDTILREDPDYEWTEADGRILVRAAAARGGALDTRVDRFAVTAVSFIDALTALVRAIDPSRPQPDVMRFGLSLEVGGQKPAPGDVNREAPGEHQAAGPRTGAEERPITIAMDGATLLDILDAIAHAHGELSWSVGYDRGGMRLEHATITLMGRGVAATAASAHAEREAPRMRDRDRLIVPMMTSLQGMLSLYTRRARVRTGIELLSDSGPALFLDVPPLDLTDVPPAAAISRIVAFDSRFEWVEANGIFNVRPKAEHAAGPSILEQPIETFSVADVTAEGALDAIGRLFGSVSAGRGSGEAGLIDVDEKEQQRRMAEGRAKTISLTLANSTFREILNALCRAHGTLSWSLQRHGERDGRRTYTIEFESYDGWSVSKSFRD